MALQVQPIKQVSLGEEVARELRALIATRQIAPGTPVAEEALAAQFGVSRGPIRDALKALTAEGLVAVKGRRAEFRGLTPEDIDELFSLREVLESATLQRALERNRVTLLAELDRSLAEMEEAGVSGDPVSFAAADLRFHSSFYVAAGHRRLAAIWDQYRPSVEMVLRASRQTYVDLTPSIQAHHRLADVIRAGDIQPVLHELADHIDNARRRVRAFYETPTA